MLDSKLPYALPLIAALLLSNRPDEGQWLPQQVRAMNWDALAARGMTLTQDEFWHPERGGVLSATVQIGGCSASFCSPDGLVVTNHHCGFGAVNALSTPERNLLRDGFVAATRSEEMLAPGMVVYVVRRIEDVTARVHAAQDAAGSAHERWLATERVIREIVAEGERQPDTTCSVASFLEGEEYHLYYRTRLTDVRLVYAPPRSVGEFGGDVDNWEWPRHTGDFSFFRAYAAPDGSPRAFHPDNVPFRPEHYLKVSADGVQADDLIVIMGYPGRTERYLTSLAVADRESVYFPLRHELLTDILEVLEAFAARGDAEQLAYAGTIKSLANVQKNAAGMIYGLARNAVVERKQREEAAFRAWLADDPEREARFGDVLDELLELDRDARRTTRKDLVLGLGLSGRVLPFLSGMTQIVEYASGLEEGATIPAPIAARIRSDVFSRDFDEVQRPILTIILDEMRHLTGDDALSGAEILSPQTDEATSALVDAMLQRTEMLDGEARLALASAGPRGIEASDDPFVVLARGLMRERAARDLREETRDGARLVVGRRWIEAQQEWRGKSFYPDANSTMRVSIASVKGYEPRDGMFALPHTTVEGLLAKDTGVEPFDAPDALTAAAEGRRDSRFFDQQIGDVPVCFLSDGDTTGGNSGSPVINGAGELVGLNFDRVFEAVSGDFGWNAERSRNISVDIRFVLWFMEQAMPAPHLLEEMGLGG